MKKFLFFLAVLLGCLGGASAQVSIFNVRVEHNVVINGKAGLKIIYDGCATGYQGHTLRLRACVDSPAGYGWMDTNGNCRDANGVVSVHQDHYMRAEVSDWYDAWIFLPYDELHLAPGTRQYAIHMCAVWPSNDHPNNALAWSDFVYFDGNGPVNTPQNSSGLSGHNMLDRTYINTPLIPVTPVQQEMQCTTCYGTGLCQVCKDPRGISYRNGAHACGGCNGTGKCATCGGSGRMH